MAHTHWLLPVLFLSIGCNGKEQEATFSSGAKPKGGFARIEEKICSEDVIERPEGWEDFKACANEGKLFVSYADPDRKDLCLSLPEAKTYECTLDAYKAKVREIQERDLELVRLYYSSADAEKEFAQYEKDSKAYLKDLFSRLDRYEDDFLLNCWEYGRAGEVGPMAVVAAEIYFPNKRTTNTKLGCSMFSQWTIDTPCYPGLRKIASGANLLLLGDEEAKEGTAGDDAEEGAEEPIDKDQILDDDELAQDPKVIDEEWDRQLETCLGEGSG